MEKELLGLALSSRADYELVISHLNVKSSSYSKELQLLLGKIGEYYARDSAVEGVSSELLMAQIGETLRSEKLVARLTEFVNEAAAGTASLANVKAVILLAKQQEVADKLSAALVTDLGSEKIDALVKELQELRARDSLDECEDEDVMMDVDLIYLMNQEYDPSNVLEIYPKSLNQRLDVGAKKGHHITIFARPNIGKTAFTVNLGSGIARQGKRIMHLINEDRKEDVYIRYVSNLSGMDKHSIRDNPAEADRIARQNGLDNVIVINIKPGTPDLIRHYIDKYKPDAVIVDQLRNLQVKAESRTNQLEASATAMRNIGKEKNVLMITVTQAGDSARDKLVLDDGDIDFSNCLAKGTEVLMFDGSKKKVEDITLGEQVMGMDGTARNVLATGSGRQPMYKITHKNGDSYTVNESHILVVKNSDTTTRAGVLGKAVADLPLRKVLEQPGLLRHLKGLWFEGKDFGTAELPIEPYLFGLWLADGFSHTFSISTSDTQLKDYLVESYSHLLPQTRVVNETNHIVSFLRQPNGYANPTNGLLRKLGVMRNKRIPELYLRASREQRLKLLAGLIDGDGSLRQECHYTIYIGNSESLTDDVLELCKSLGFYCMKGKSHPTCFVVRLSGKVTQVPVVLDRKKATRDSQIDFLCSDIRVEKVSDDDEYYGITVDGDERYVLGNYIITHNTGIPAQADVLIGIGCSEEYEAQELRMLTLIKNKIGAIEEHFPVKINRPLSRYLNV